MKADNACVCKRSSINRWPDGNIKANASLFLNEIIGGSDVDLSIWVETICPLAVLCNDFICWNVNIVHSCRRKGRWMFSTLLLAQ